MLEQGAKRVTYWICAAWFADTAFSTNSALSNHVDLCTRKVKLSYHKYERLPNLPHRLLSVKSQEKVKSEEKLPIYLNDEANVSEKGKHDRF